MCIHLCIYIYIYSRVYVYTYYKHVYTHISLSLYIYIHMYVCSVCITVLVHGEKGSKGYLGAPYSGSPSLQAYTCHCLASFSKMLIQLLLNNDIEV